MVGSCSRNATIAQTSSLRSGAAQAGMPVNLTPCRTIQNSSLGSQSWTRSGRKGGGGVIDLATAERSCPGAPWQGAQPVA